LSVRYSFYAYPHSGNGAPSADIGIMGLKPDQGMNLRRMRAVSWVWEYVFAVTRTNAAAGNKLEKGIALTIKHFAGEDFIKSCTDIDNGMPHIKPEKRGV
jgi:hypothetical protein